MDGGFIANSLKIGSIAAQLATELAVSIKEDAQKKMKQIEQEADAKVSCRGKFTGFRKLH